MMREILSPPAGAPTDTGPEARTAATGAAPDAAPDAAHAGNSAETPTAMDSAYAPRAAYNRGTPWLGVFTAIPRGWRGSSPIGPQTVSYRALQRAARRAGMRLVVFTPEGLRPATRQVVGFRWSRRRQQWVRLVAPLPHVVYNRVPRRETEAEAHVQWAMRYLQGRGIPMFNPRFLDKWEVYRVLSRHPQCRPHLPPTVLLDDDLNVAEALDAWREVVLKPVAGSLGRGVIFISVAGREPGYRFNAHVGRRHIKGTLRTVAELRRFIRRHVRRRPYLMQQAVDRVRYHGRPVDIRALVQRNSHGEWVLTGMGARVAGAGRVVTHVPQGGSRTSVDQALAPSFTPAELAAVKELAAQTGIQAGRALVHGTGELFGELSLDLAVDRQGRVWILECNAKPFQFDEPRIRRVARRHLVQFAHYLVTNSPGRPGSGRPAAVMEEPEG
ncbi:MAG TPA: YheC/YheD family protein [Sphingobacteriaceae bacterium]|nr:YheC/YheD family protein [Sphingobacteriaceae bacterium]